MTDSDNKAALETSTIVLVDDVKGLGKAGDLKRIPPERADALVLAGKVRRATLEDFPAVKR